MSDSSIGSLTRNSQIGSPLVGVSRPSDEAVKSSQAGEDKVSQDTVSKSTGFKASSSSSDAVIGVFSSSQPPSAPDDSASSSTQSGTLNKYA